jgi:hypothetical protein
VDYLLNDGRTYTNAMTARANSRSNIRVDHESFDGGATYPLAGVDPQWSAGINALATRLQ